MGLAWSPSAWQPQPDSAILEALGEAYAREAGLTFLRADVAATDTVGTNRGEMAMRLEQALAVGYAPKRGSFFLLPLGELQDLLKLEMEGGRSPSAVVNDVVVQGNVVLWVRWTFDGVEPIESHTIFSSRGELLLGGSWIRLIRFVAPRGADGRAQLGILSDHVRTTGPGSIRPGLRLVEN